MLYINALELINISVKNNILKEVDKKILVFRKGGGSPKSKPGWYLDEKDIVAKELMNSIKGQELLISALKEKGVDFQGYSLG